MPAKYIYSLDNSQPMTIQVESSATVVAGDIGSVSGGEVGLLSAAGTGIMGIIMGPGDDGDMVPVLLCNPSSVIRVPYAGTTKTSLAKADLFGTAFDWDATAKKLNLDDTTGGMFRVIAYNNTAKTADVVIDPTNLWNA